MSGVGEVNCFSGRVGVGEIGDLSDGLTEVALHQCRDEAARDQGCSNDAKEETRSKTLLETKAMSSLNPPFAHCTTYIMQLAYQPDLQRPRSTLPLVIVAHP